LVNILAGLVDEGADHPFQVGPEGWLADHRGPGNQAGYCDQEAKEVRTVEGGATEVVAAANVGQSPVLRIAIALESAEKLKAAMGNLSLLFASEERKSGTLAGTAGVACWELKLSGRQE
jgi:hypothetical protein